MQIIRISKAVNNLSTALLEILLLRLRPIIPPNIPPRTIIKSIGTLNLGILPVRIAESRLVICE